jgi:preprotein translocase subunit YajC
VLISPAFAQAAGASPESSLMSFLPLILMFVVLYFLMIRPQMKRAKEHKAMISALNKGDEVVTAAGVVGKITEVGDAYVTVDIGTESPVTIHMQKQAVQTLLPKGTIKGI